MIPQADGYDAVVHVATPNFELGACYFFDAVTIISSKIPRMHYSLFIFLSLSTLSPAT